VHVLVLTIDCYILFTPTILVNVQSIKPVNQNSFILSVVSLTTGPQPLPKRILHRVRRYASYFNFHYPFFSLRSSGCCICLRPRLPVTFILSLDLAFSNVVLEGGSYARCDQFN